MCMNSYTGGGRRIRTSSTRAPCDCTEPRICRCLPPWYCRELPNPKIADMETGKTRPNQIPVHLIETINEVVRTSRQMLPEIGREPTPEELAERLAMPLE